MCKGLRQERVQPKSCQNSVRLEPRDSGAMAEAIMVVRLA